MKNIKKILPPLLVIVALCLLISGLLKEFLREIPTRTVEYHTNETVYYAPLETGPEETLPPETLPETLPETVPQTIPETVPGEVRKTYETVPNYYETDYPDIRFGSGFFPEYGSGVTSVAMVASYLTGYEYLPDQLAGWFSNYIGNQIQILEYISDELQLPWEKAENFHVAVQALREGKVVIALMGQNSIFTSGQHFIVLTGINEAGKIMVNDPNRNNYSHWAMQTSFVEGFREGEILCGYSGAWIYDPAQVPEEPFRYVDQTPPTERRYPDLTLSQQEVDILAKLIYAEAQSEPFEGQQAIAEVVLNRIAAANFPNSLNGVVYAPDQFLAINQIYAAKPTHIQYEAVRRALEGPYIMPEDVVFFSSGPVNSNVWGSIGNHTFCHQW